MGYLKRLALVLITICIVIGMSGCGGKGGLGKSSDNTLSGSFSPKNDAIWYYVDAEDEVGKDTKISKAMVFRDGKFKVYTNTKDDFTLGYTAQTSDDEVITKLEEDKKEKEVKMKAYLDKAKAGSDTILASGVFDGDQQRSASDGVTYNFSADKGIFDTISKSLVSYTIPEPGQEIKFGVYTDSSGNAVDGEIIAFRDVQISVFPSLYNQLGKVVDVTYTPSTMIALMTQFLDVDSFGGVVNKSNGLGSNILPTGTEDITKPMSLVCPECTTTIEVTNALDPTRGAIKVYDTTYTGYLCDGDLLLTNADGKSFVMDDLKKEGLVIDPKDDDLFKE